MKIVCFSDTHGRHNKIKVPDGDILIFAGDTCNDGSQEESLDFRNWLNYLPHKHKIIIAGTHDLQLEKIGFGNGFFNGIATYLQDNSIIIDGIKIYGSPWHAVGSHWAFTIARGKESKQKWDKIPNNTDILITHTPPYSILDMTSRGRPVGCRDLLKAVTERIKPKYHVFGHIHYSHGVSKVKETTYINGSIYCQKRSPILGKPIVLNYEKEKVTNE